MGHPLTDKMPRSGKRFLAGEILYICQCSLLQKKSSSLAPDQNLQIWGNVATLVIITSVHPLVGYRHCFMNYKLSWSSVYEIFVRSSFCWQFCTSCRNETNSNLEKLTECHKIQIGYIMLYHKCFFGKKIFQFRFRSSCQSQQQIQVHESRKSTIK